MNMINKLNRMKKHLQHTPSGENKEQKQVKVQTSTSFDVPNKKEWQDFQTNVFYFQEEHCLIREVEYSLDFCHGIYKLGELLPIIKRWQDVEVDHPLSAKGHQVTDLFFFDTETTGLSGGVGTTIFLLGYARVFSDKVVIRQHLLPSPGNEIALYQSFLEEVNYSTLVTYNGKAFDWPQVKTRHTLIREQVPKLPAFGHFDLLHAARRLWKNKMESVRLANVEKEILKIERKDDIPGFLAPMIYFDFVKTHEMQGIKGVMKHNELDVLTLITLYIHLSKLLLSQEMGMNKEEVFEIGRWYDVLGQKEAATSRYKNIVENSWQASYKLGLLKKKEKNYEEAKKWFIHSFYLQDNMSKEMVGIELAKIFEHQEKDCLTALKYAEISYKLYRQKNAISTPPSEKTQLEMEKRIKRLKRKIGM
ncbi:ribonuclease H-like domain-containing protein [Sutcliffiella rhizosphaerae]|uniref:YprB ribonuclease H-like domain-containing protein n=1 Tax=Sutcliffiella rhizosphaerae TaxID=2880967 RepID=A0ABM8YRQ6_9BACI|nr:ribonuclease H-like domain-containing protein [Sutcliffiella rhizosphaerae]CAG9622601.1 hypothetical protein BACCIP111883_03392 [Sutcliffiella rhizosphaerae]